LRIGHSKHITQTAEAVLGFIKNKNTLYELMDFMNKFIL